MNIIILVRGLLNRNSHTSKNCYLKLYDMSLHMHARYWTSKSQAGPGGSDYCNFEVFLCNLSMNAGFAFSRSLTYEARAWSTKWRAFPASSIIERRVLRQSFLFSSRCSNLQRRNFQLYTIVRGTAKKKFKTPLRRSRNNE